jgi:hypothetical protein
MIVIALILILRHRGVGVILLLVKFKNILDVLFNGIEFLGIAKQNTKFVIFFHHILVIFLRFLVTVTGKLVANEFEGFVADEQDEASFIFVNNFFKILVDYFFIIILVDAPSD